MHQRMFWKLKKNTHPQLTLWLPSGGKNERVLPSPATTMKWGRGEAGAEMKPSGLRRWACHSHYTPIKSQTTRKRVGNIYIWNFPIDTWGLDYNLFTVSDLKKKKGWVEKERKWRRGWGKGGEERKPRLTDVIARGVGFQETLQLAALVHKRQTNGTFRWLKLRSPSSRTHTPSFRFSKVNIEEYKMRCQYYLLQKSFMAPP